MCREPERRIWRPPSGVKACQLGKQVRFYRITDLLTKMIEARDERNLERLKRGLANLDLLILDKLGFR